MDKLGTTFKNSVEKSGFTSPQIDANGPIWTAVRRSLAPPPIAPDPPLPDFAEKAFLRGILKGGSKIPRIGFAPVPLQRRASRRP
jgi:hypothetical protein